jgi:hypothetical protein
MTVSIDIKCACGANYTSFDRHAVARERLPRFLHCLRQFCRSWIELRRSLEKRSKITLVGVALVALTPGSTIAFAQANRGTAEQRAACTPDALRLCGGSIFDASKVERCLRIKKGELSAPCRSVFEPNPGLVATRSK